MAADSTAMAKPVNGFKTMIDTIIAPKEAFEALRVKPTWIIAVVTAIVISLISSYVSQDAAIHAGVATAQHMQAGPLGAQMSDDQKRQQLERAGHPNFFVNAASGIGAFIVALLINSLILWIAVPIGKGDRGFGTLFAASANIAIPSQSLALIVMAIVAKIKGPEAFSSALDMYRSIPGLGFIPAHGYLGAFLTYISVFVIWGVVLSAMMLRITANVKNAAISWILPILIMLLGASLIGVFGLFS